MTDLLPTAETELAALNPQPVEAPEAAVPGQTSDEPATEQRTRLVLDTSVLIADPTCILEFRNADVIVPLTVVEELDGLKSRSDDVGRAARTALRTLEELRVRHGGSLAAPVPTGAESEWCSRTTPCFRT